MEKLINILETPKIIIISGIGLATSLWAMMSKTSLILDPAWISIILSGIPILYYAIRNLWIKKRITAPLLISTAIISCIALEEIFAAGEVAFIMALGELLEDYTIKRTKRGINKLINLAPQTARRISTQNGKDEIVPAIEIRKGDTLRILPGETIPADGIIINKADGDNVDKAQLAAAQFRNALHLFPPAESGWTPKVLTYSGYYNIGIKEIWDMVDEYVAFTKKNGYFDYKRNEQAKYWMYESINDTLRDTFYHNPAVEEKLAMTEQQVLRNEISSFVAAKRMMDLFLENISGKAE